MKRVIGALLLVAAGTVSPARAAQQSEPKPAGTVTEQRLVDLPLPRRSFRPKLSLQHALKIAEDYIESEKIDISPYYLYEAKYILYGGEGHRQPCWFFWWIKENGAAGDYVEIIVPIDSGKARRLPSM